MASSALVVAKVTLKSLYASLEDQGGISIEVPLYCIFGVPWNLLCFFKIVYLFACYSRSRLTKKLAESEEDLLEHRTDGTDAFDTLFIGCEKFPQSEYSGGVVDMGGVM